jgi:hypothetical protein
MRRLLGALSLVLLAACTATATGPTPSSQVSTAVRDLHEGQVIDGVPCLRDELPPRHIHVHLGIYLDGGPITVPAGIGVGRPWGVDPMGFVTTGGCFSWIHTHDTTGVVHVFSEPGRSFSLAQVFEVWGRPLGGGALGYQGAVVVLVDGARFGGDPRSVALTPFEDIILELGKPPAVQPRPYGFGMLNG